MKNMKLDSKFGLVFGGIGVLVGIFAALAVFFVWDGEFGAPIIVLILVGVAVLIVVASLGAALRKSVCEPAKFLAAQTSKLARGENIPEIKNMGDSELGDIAKSINKISSDMLALKKFVEELLSQAAREGARIEPPTELGAAFAEIGKTAERIAREYGDEIRDIVFLVEKFVAGDVNMSGKVRPAKAYSRALERLSIVLQNIQKDVKNLSQATIEGSFQNAAEIGKYEGDWKKMAESVNGARTAVLAQLQNLEENLIQLGRGELGARLKQDARGDFSKVKGAFNNAAAALDKNVNSVHLDVLAASSGTRPRSEYPADFAKIRTALTDLVDKAEKANTPTPTRTTNLRPTEARRGVTDAGRMSGAKKINEAALKGGQAAPFMRQDFGKY
ncbi:MAG: hypothetical protein LBE35_11460 [Clostridiales bacterium]|jgi:methyl-accepting chemotaxis protein|nr:hypothetical protein [Clostridiales bacterium]